ncbi:SAM-dependent methyltransferase [Methylacidiphilum sp. Yel]|jgi:23S rRNA (cytosine1962-C5)-methyltransferase|uniref:class I SAM-dependent rRNA methyltransferase n=1 Tax=Methylacidiphilum sp. Yel TaxID=1847730 RepID=UPI00106A6594|nr:class I SAM-dependent rRNA methyltransferase [Methylacidiphilum sp. Yel]TFE66091.1 SAM-dependent methyltransferase [Methylacidiphilum sp. Yel]
MEPSPFSGKVYLIKEGRHRILEGHVWVYRTEISHFDEHLQNGDVVEVISANGQNLGVGIWNSQSQISVRIYSRERVPLDKNIIVSFLTNAFKYREQIFSGKRSNAYRLFWSESDGFPGLVIDRYADWYVVQLLTSGADRKRGEILDSLQQLTSSTNIIVRNDAPVRLLEGLPLTKECLAQQAPGLFSVTLDGVTILVDILNGQKTGLYLDQAANYRLIANMAKDKRVLDCFSYQGLFSIFCALQGAKHCIAVDQSAAAIGIGKKNADSLGLRIEWVCENAFDWLRKKEKEKQKFDLIILDPPSFTKTKVQKESAFRGYHEIHLRALNLLEVGGYLASFCCSHHIMMEEWKELIAKASWETHTRLRYLNCLPQSADHPILFNIPETEYLKGVLAQKID